MRFACACVNVRIQQTKIARKPQRPHLQSISQYSLEHIFHVSDTRDIPTSNILVEGISLTAFNLMPSGDVRDVICVCVCEC
jgi:acetyl-CoA carboxylase alpha subunit